MPYPALITTQADIELETFVSAAIIDEFNSREEQGFMNLRVGIDIQIFPNYNNIVLLKDVNGEREPILTQCRGMYIPEQERLAAGEVPYVRLDREIQDIPDHVFDKMIGADPRVVETGQSLTGLAITDVVPAPRVR